MNNQPTFATVTKTKVLFKNSFTQTVYDFNLQAVNTSLLDKKIWAVPKKEHLLRQVVLAQQASWRLNTKKVKDRSEVSGGGKKPWKQKGSGRARHGSNRSPIWRGGGITFGPTGEENYRQKNNKKVFQQATKMLLSNFLETSNLFIWENVDLVKPKTKTVIALLRSLNLSQEKVLFLTNKDYPHLQLSLNNLSNVKMILTENLNPYDLINYDKLLLEQSALSFLNKHFQD